MDCGENSIVRYNSIDNIGKQKFSGLSDDSFDDN